MHVILKQMQECKDVLEPTQVKSCLLQAKVSPVLELKL